VNYFQKKKNPLSKKKEGDGQWEDDGISGYDILAKGMYPSCPLEGGREYPPQRKSTFLSLSEKEGKGNRQWVAPAKKKRKRVHNLIYFEGK